MRTSALVGLLCLLAAPAAADSARIVIGAGYGSASGVGVVEGGFRFVFFGAAAPTKIPRVTLRIAGMYGEGDGAIGAVDLGAVTGGLEYAPWDNPFRVSAGLVKASALLAETGNDLVLVGREQRWVTGIAGEWERVRGAPRVAISYTWPGKAPAKAVTSDLCGRWWLVRGCASRTKRRIGGHGSSMSVSVFWPIGKL